MTRLYNTPTGPDDTSQDVRATQEAACRLGGCSHLTPITEAELDNLMFPEQRRVVPSREKVIRANEPGSDSSYDWMDGLKGPSPAEVAEIEAEAQ